jgi:PAS domain S-box-containing protein
MQLERPPPRLSPREQQLITHAKNGLTDAGIAHELGISEGTVSTYWGRVRIKLGSLSRTELVALTMTMENEVVVNALRIENERLSDKMHLGEIHAGGLTFRDLLESAPDAMILVSDAGIIEYVNVAALELFGYKEGELNEEQISRLVPIRFRAGHAGHRADYISHPDRRQMGEHLETPALHKDGSEILISAALSVVTNPATGSTSVICAIRPLTV